MMKYPNERINVEGGMSSLFRSTLRESRTEQDATTQPYLT